MKNGGIENSNFGITATARTTTKATTIPGTIIKEMTKKYQNFL